MKNAFNMQLYDIKEVFEDGAVESAIRTTLISVLAHLGISTEKSERIINECLELAKNYDSVSDYEKQAHEVLAREGVTKEVPKKLTGRAQRVYDQVSPYLVDGSVLDLGCGDGKVAELLAREGRKVVLVDVYKHSNVASTGLKFRLFEQGEDVPANDNEFDNSLVLTVFHHSDDPIKTLKEAYRVTKNKGRVLVIESVYGVDGSELPLEERDKAKSYLSLNPEQQRKVNIFFDHFYNRVIHYSEDPLTKVNVPFNFNTPDGWKEHFEANGFEQERVVHLGIDQPTVPEYHTLHVLIVRK